MSKENISDMSIEEKYTYLLFMRLRIQDSKISPINKIIAIGCISATIKMLEFTMLKPIIKYTHYINGVKKKSL